MCGKLIYLASFVVATGLIGAAEAAFETVGVYDPDNEPHHNQVDQSGTYDSHTGDAGPENIVDLATFQALIGPAFDADAGGVVNIETTHGSLDGQDIVANFGVGQAKSLTLSGISGIINVGASVKNGRTPISGLNRLAKSETANFEFDIGPVTGGVPGEAVTYVAGSLLDRDAANLAPVVTATFSGGGTVTATATMSGDGPSCDQDTFFGFVAPEGQSIVHVNFNPTGGPYTNLDDVAFITSAFVVVSAEASNPSPADGVTDVPRDVVLGWTPGEYAPAVDGHRVYLSENFSDVNDGIGGITHSATSYAPAQRLDLDTAYYWRVDEVNAPPDSTAFPGEVWSFTTEPVGYPIDGENIATTASSAGEADFGPEKTIDGSGLDDNNLHSTGATHMWLSGSEPLGAWIHYELDKVYRLHEMWVWNSNQVFERLFGFGFKDVTVEYSTDGTDWTALASVPEFAQAPGTEDYAHDTTVDFGGAAAKYVRLTATSNWGGVLPQYGLSEVRFFYIPVIAREPSPDSGAMDVDVNVTLGWRAGREASTHDVYFSADEQVVIDGTAPTATVADASYSPSPLDLGSTYFWRVDEVNDAETPTIWQGNIWSFSTSDYLVVDDFESYNDVDPPDPESHRIFEAWSDGYSVATNGALVGYDPPQHSYAETVIVHGGYQAMPLFYSNAGGATYSETERTFAVSQDWTEHGIQTLVLYFHGTEGNTGQLYVKINGVKVAYPGDATDISLLRWKQWNIDLASLGVNLQSVMTLAIGIDGNGAGGTLYVDDIVLYRLAPEVI
ncbi:MAG: discoidin domain-containing protein [Phycisphaerales bacterium]|nr:MAG: discoidin domain-containing protein [Phycisphaerales bacterium]